MDSSGLSFLLLLALSMICVACGADDMDNDSGGDHMGHGHENGADHMDNSLINSNDYADEECPSTDYHFNADKYIEYLPAIPKLERATVCAFITSDSEGGVPGVVASYGTSRRKKLILVTGDMSDKKSLLVTVDRKPKRAQLRLTPNEEYHLCFVIDTPMNKVHIHVNGNASPTTLKYRSLRTLPGEGKLLIGKANHDASLHYSGKIRNFMMWDKKLESTTIAEVYESNKCTGDEIVILRPHYVLFHGAFVHMDECPSSDYTFNNGEGSEEYLEILTPMPTVEFGTGCMWVTTDETGMLPGTVGSYAEGDNMDIILIEGVLIKKVKSIKLVLNGVIKIGPSRFEPLTEYLSCTHRFLPRGESRQYVNGKFVRARKFENIAPSAQGGGVTIIGQRQGCLGGCFDKKRAFNGRIRDFTMWKRILSDEEIMAIYQKNLCPVDHVNDILPEHVLPHGKFFTYEDCPVTEYNLLQDTQTQYLESVVPFPNMDYFTVCVKVTTDEKGMVPGTIGSYATREAVDVIVAGGEMSEGGPVLRVMVQGQAQLLASPLYPRTEYAFCVRFHIPQSQVYTFINGQRIRVVQYDNLASIPGGGKLIIGQRQTCWKAHGACFKEESAYTGKIKNFMIWNRALSDEEIKSIAVEEQCPTNAVITAAPQSVLPEGRFFPFETCKGLEHTFENTGDKKQYLVSSDTLPMMSYFTICVRTTTNKFGAIPGTIASYVTKDKVDVLVAGGQMGDAGPQIFITVEGETIFLDQRLMPNTEYAFCVTFHLLLHGHVRTYVNGNFIREIMYKARSTPGGGKIVIGQRQTCYDGENCLDPVRAYTGLLRDFMVWDRPLAEDEIKAIATKNECPTGATITNAPERVIRHGMV